MLPFTIRVGDGTGPAFDEMERVDAVDVDRPVLDGFYAILPLPPLDITLPLGCDRVEVPFRLTGDDRVIVPLRVNGGPVLQVKFNSGGSLQTDLCSGAADIRTGP